MKKQLFILAGTLLPVVSFAHPGHDHSHWTSDLTHGALLFAIVAFAAMATKIIHSRSKASIEEEN